MADLTQVEKINLLLKMAFGVQGLSNTDDANGLRWFNEKFSWQPFVLNKEVYASDVPFASTIVEADAAVAAYPTLIEKRDIVLSPVNGANGRAWIAYKTLNDPVSGVYADWLLPQIFGTGYAMRLFKDNGSGGIGTEITTTEGAWIPAYKLGAVILAAGYTASDLGWTTNLHARVYRYVGGKGMTGSNAHVSLDNAYDEGRTISADEGPVVINAASNYAPLQITPIAYTPSASLADGQLCNRAGILYVYDETRVKWVSVDKPTPVFSTQKGDGNYLTAGYFSDANSGYVALKDGVIVGVTASGGSGNLTKSFSVRKNSDPTDILTFSLTAGKYYSDTANVNFSAGDVLQVYCSADGAAVNAPLVQLIVAWRL